MTAVNETTTDQPVEIAVIGGGCAGLTAAFELSRPIHAGGHRVTVYQQGWRLGGKGASGRGVAGRIEEHGLHVWLGFYENAFRLLRETYAELAEHPDKSPFGDWREALMPEPDIGVFAPDAATGRRLWRAHFPPRPGLPGDPVIDEPADPMTAYVAGALAMLRTLLLDTAAEPLEGAPEPPDDWREIVARLLDKGVLIGAVAIAQALLLLGVGLRTRNLAGHSALLGMAERTAAALREWTERRFLQDHPDRHVWLMAELVMASLVGIVRHRLIGHPEGLDSIDDWDCRDWLRANGASEAAVRSPFVQGLYDLVMAYEDGDPERPRSAAGGALRGLVRMFFGYRGALFWRMRAGMGDVVFAPLYECLRRRGVRFRFFHRLVDIGLGMDGEHVDALRFDEQVRLAAGRSYDPLIRVAGRPCWPAEPRWELLDTEHTRAGSVDFESHDRERPAETVELKVGRDFDFVVLAVGVGALPHVAPALLAARPRWREMTRRVKTVASQAVQLWLRNDLPTLGWRGDPLIMSGLPKPFDTWCDMGHVIPEEGWAEAGREPPGTAVYFCGVLPDRPELAGETVAGRERAAHERVREAALELLAGPAAALWPRLRAGGGPNSGPDWTMLAGETGPDGGDGLYWRANTAPSERYTLSLPGSTRWRISPLTVDFDNLTVAGDWTANGLNTGCTEAAVMSGMLAAHALCGTPALADITGFDHP